MIEQKTTSNQSYLQAKIIIEYEETLKDELTIAIDMDTLEFNGFYSQEQACFIPIIESSQNTFIENYNKILQTQILKYLKLLKLQEEQYREESDKIAESIVRKHLTKKKLKQE